MRGANAFGLTEFINEKCKSGRVEIASFFRKAIPEDMPSWITRNGERLSRRGGLIGPSGRSSSHGTPETQNATSAVRTHLLMCAKQLRQIGSYEEIAVEIDRIISNANAQNDVEQLEQRLSDLERRMTELTKSHLSAEETSRIQGEISARLAVFRAKMTTAQIDMLERQCYTKLLFERGGVPRLSLFYIRENLSRAA